MTFGERLEMAMIEMKWGPKDLERGTGVPDSTISALVRRGSDLSKYKERLIRHFPVTKISHDWLREEVGTMIPSTQTIESAGRMPAGITYIPVAGIIKVMDNMFFEEADTVPGLLYGFVCGVSEDTSAYAYKVRGDSMAPALRDGWYVVVEPQTNPTVGEYVLVKMHDGTCMVVELLYERTDSIAVMSLDGKVRQTLSLADIKDDGIQAVVSIIPPSKWVSA